MDKILFLKKKKEICETSIAYSQDRINSMEEELAVINEMISEIEGREDNVNPAQ